MKSQISEPGILEKQGRQGEIPSEKSVPARATSNDWAAPWTVSLIPYPDKLQLILLYLGCAALLAVSTRTALEQYRRLSATDEQFRELSSRKVELSDSWRREMQNASDSLRQSAKQANMAFSVDQAFGIALLGIVVLLFHKNLRNLARAKTKSTQTDQFLGLLLNGIVKQGLYSLDPKGTIVAWNGGAQELTGYSAHEIVGQPHGILYTQTDQTAGLPESDLRVALQTGRYEAARERIARDGQKLWGSLMFSPLYSGSGKLTGFAAAFADISTRKKAEVLVAMQTQELERSNTELSQFAYIASHDLQEPLRKITALGDRLRRRNGTELGQAGLEDLSRMQRAAQRMSQLIENLLLLSRVASQPWNLESTDLNQTVREVIADLEETIKETGARVESTSLPVIMADRSQMRQLIQNLVSNALKYKKSDENPLIRISSEMTAPAIWKIEISDNGIGFDEKYRTLIFRPFRRLAASKSTQGSGMGLAICRKIIARHGGQVFAKSKPGEGTTIVLHLPESPRLEGVML